MTRKKKATKPATVAAAASDAPRRRPSRRRSAAASGGPKTGKAPPASLPPSGALTASERKTAIRARSGVKRPPEPAAANEPYPIGKARKHLKGIAIYMHPLAKEALDRIARSERKTMQELGLEALNLLFRHYDEKPIA